MSEKPAYPSDWTSKIAFMREHGVVSATWSDNIHPSVLIDVRLAPDAPATDVGPAEQQETAFARQQRERKERRELAQRASGGPVPRLDEGH